MKLKKILFILIATVLIIFAIWMIFREPHDPEPAEDRVRIATAT